MTSTKRAASIPNIPTIAEAGVPGYELTSWYGVLAPAGTPEPIVRKLNAAMVGALAGNDLRDQLLAGGVSYQIGKAYNASFVPTYDLEENDFRLFTLNLQRELPDMTLIATFGYDANQDQYFGGLNIAIGGAQAPSQLFSSQAIDR